MLSVEVNAVRGEHTLAYNSILLLPAILSLLQLAEEQELEKQAAVQAAERYR